MRRFNWCLSIAVFIFMLLSISNCASPKEIVSATFEDSVPFKVKSVYFQEWFAGIENAGTGYTLYMPVVKKGRNVTVEDVYFRNLKGKFHLKDGRYIAILKNPNKNYIFSKAEKPVGYPFNLRDDECVITYIEDGSEKFYKIAMQKELAGTYYKHGAPSIYTRSVGTTLATVDKEED